jgi:hypothetical protein
MDEPELPQSTELLAQRLREVKKERVDRHARNRARSMARRRLTTSQRAAILAKTDSRCHICGGRVVDKWHADHVLAHSDGGPHSVENYLAAHALCNNYRWDYTPEEFQWVLKIGVWARTQMEAKSELGRGMLKRFFEYERRREARRVCHSGKEGSDRNSPVPSSNTGKDGALKPAPEETGDMS